ncbi:unnamed protein product [Trifolium pratense]|uniref:Uncharacterized protein n=1 Tax=Trifolium pratense TaxID=57577 RepID=A0ACB0KRJ8_TRIPR|nr:unnamed protein product [Trifolium pratense]
MKGIKNKAIKSVLIWNVNDQRDHIPSKKYVNIARLIHQENRRALSRGVLFVAEVLNQAAVNIQSAWNKSVCKIFNEHSRKKIIYLGFLKGSVKDSEGFAKKKLRGVDEIEGENIVGVGNGNFKITFMPMYLKVFDHEQRLEKYTRAAIIIHYMMQPSLDRYDVSIVAYGQNHSEKTHIMVDLANELDFLLAWPKGKEVNVCSWSSLIDRNDWLTTILGETLAQFWNTLMGSLEEMKTGFPFDMLSLRAFQQWDLGELNFPMATGTCDCCWNYLIIF